MKKIWCFFIILLLLPITANAEEKIPTFLYDSEKELSAGNREGARIIKVNSDCIYIAAYDNSFEDYNLYQYKKSNFSLVNQKTLFTIEREKNSYGYYTYTYYNDYITYNENDNYIYVINCRENDSKYTYELIKYDLNGKKISSKEIANTDSQNSTYTWLYFHIINNYIYYFQYNDTEIKKLDTNGNLVSTIDTGTNTLSSEYRYGYAPSRQTNDKFSIECNNWKNICTLTEDDKLEVVDRSDFKLQAKSFGNTTFYYNTYEIYKYDENNKLVKTQEFKNKYIDLVTCSNSYCYIYTEDDGVIITDYDLNKIKSYPIYAKSIANYYVYNDRLYTVGATYFGSGVTGTYYFNAFGLKDEEEKDVQMLLTETSVLADMFESLNDYTGKINWIIDDDSIIKIENGKAIPLKLGTTTIHCEVLGTVYYINVNVTEIKNTEEENSKTKNPVTSDNILILFIIAIILSAFILVLKSIIDKKKSFN